jgi:hypothetical protein
MSDYDQITSACEEIIGELRKANHVLEIIARSLYKLAKSPLMASPAGEPTSTQVLPDVTYVKDFSYVQDFSDPFACCKCGVPGKVRTEGKVYCIEHVPNRFVRQP